MLTRLVDWFRSIRRAPTAEELKAREEAQELLDQKDTIRVLDRFGPERVHDRHRTGRGPAVDAMIVPDDEEVE